MARMPASRDFSSAGSRLGGSRPGAAGGDISGTWMVTVNGHGRSEYTFECRASGEVTGKGRPAAGGTWLSELKGFHASGGKFTWTSYVNNREAGRFEAIVVSDLTSFNGSGTLITGKRLEFTGARTTGAAPVIATPGAAARAGPAPMVSESLAGVSMQEVGAAGNSSVMATGVPEPSPTEVRAEQDIEFQLGLIRDQAKDVETQLKKEMQGIDELSQKVDVLKQKVQNVVGQRARYGENPKNIADLEKAQAELAEAQEPFDAKQLKIQALQAELEEKQDLLAAVQAALA